MVLRDLAPYRARALSWSACVRQDHYEEVKAKLATAVAALKSGSPHEEDTYIGPIIAVKEAQRIEAWVKEALDKGEPVPYCGQYLLSSNAFASWQAKGADGGASLRLGQAHTLGAQP